MDTERVTSHQPQSLREWREGEQITTEVAAKRLRISQGFYSHLEIGTRRASGKTAKRIHQKTHVPVEVLVGAA